MRRLLTFECEGFELGGSFDGDAGDTALLMVTGGTQTRIGSHRMYERLANALVEHGISCLRFDRRGVGDSGGGDPDYRGSGPDMAAAAAALRREVPAARRLLGFGLCDGATALALFGAEAGVDRLLLANPWFVEAEANAPPPAAIKHHYRQQLMSLDGWKRLIGGSISYRKLLKGVMSIANPAPTHLAAEVASKMGTRPLPVQMIVARGDATAIAAQDIWCSKGFTRVRGRSPAPIEVDSDSHTFARPGDEEALLAAVLGALRS